MATDPSKKKPFFMLEGGVDLADIVIRELDMDHSRSKIVVLLTADTPRGTVLEETGGTWALASNYTGRLGILTEDAVGRADAQEVGVVDADAVVAIEPLGIPEGKKSVAYSITLRAADRTLTVEECDNAVAKVMKALDKIGVALRQ